MVSTTSILLWITLLFSTLAMAFSEGEKSQPLARRDCGEADPLCKLYDAATKGQTGATNNDGTAIVPRAVVNPKHGTSAADTSLGQRAGGLTTIVVAGSFIWTLAM